MKKERKSAASAAQTMEEKDLATMQGKTENRYADFNKMESDFWEGYCCYECYIAALKERMEWLIMENNRLRQLNG